MPGSVLDELLAKIKKQSPQDGGSFVELDPTPDELLAIQETKPTKCHVPQLDPFFKWKKHFSYLFTGTPNTGKTTMTTYLATLRAHMEPGYRAIIWTPEMEDATLDSGSVRYNVKDTINQIVWTKTGKNPFHSNIFTIDEIKAEYEWVNKHFTFFHAHNRTPEGLAKAFKNLWEKHGGDTFIIDAWKSVNQEITGRSDTWLENMLLLLKELSLETGTNLVYVVHPRSLKDYSDPNEEGEYRPITAFDLNGGAAWNNSMDIIVSLRRRKAVNQMEWYALKIRKQHLMGIPGEPYCDITFDRQRNRYLFGGIDPFSMQESNADLFKAKDDLPF
jgi:hypothetical protein